MSDASTYPSVSVITTRRIPMKQKRKRKASTSRLSEVHLPGKYPGMHPVVSSAENVKNKYPQGSSSGTIYRNLYITSEKNLPLDIAQQQKGCPDHMDRECIIHTKWDIYR